MRLSQTRLCIAAGLLAFLNACGDQHPVSVGQKVVYQEARVEVPRPCPVTKPVRPKPLTRPLPSDPARLVDLLAGKLLEWAGAGGYGDKADAAISTCTKP
jgi:hypothetical protein